MSEEAITPSKHAYVKLYHHCGALVSIPVDVNSLLTTEMAGNLFTSINNLVHAGFTADPPRLEEGEQKIACRWLVRRGRAAEDGTVTPIVDLYADEDRMVFPVLTMYLNTAHDIAACSRATGIDVLRCPEYEGTGKLERNKDRRQDKYFCRFEQACNVVRKKNPQYNPEEKDVKKKKNQFLFVRWADLPATTDAPAPTQPATAAPPSAQFIARSAQTAGSFIGRFTACMNEGERKAIVNGMTKELVGSLTPEDLAKVRLAYKHAGERLKEHATVAAAFDDAPPPSEDNDLPPEDEDVR